MTSTNSIGYEREVKRILDELNDELYRQVTKTKKEIILKGAKLLEELGIPKKTICAELSHGLRGISERMVRKTLGPEYKMEENIRGTSTAIEDKKDIEEDARKVAEKYGIDLDAGDEPNQVVYNKLVEKMKIVQDERDWYKEKYDETKHLQEAKEGVSNEFVLHPNSYDGLREMMEKSPFGIRIVHDRYSIHLSSIEQHCKYDNPEFHRTEISRILQQQQLGKGPDAESLL